MNRFLPLQTVMVIMKIFEMPRSGGMERIMKVLLVNGSPHSSGSTFTALNEMAKILPRTELNPK